MMRTSATVLESFRLFMDPEQEWMTEAKLIDSIKGTGVFETPELRFGKAFGQVLERPERYAVPSPLGLGIQGYQNGDFYFPVDDIQRHIDRFDRRGVFEAKGDKVYGDVVVVAKADQLCGAEIVEVKTKFSPFDFDRYHDSCQWRFMADIFTGANRITYLVFPCVLAKVGGPDRIDDPHPFNLYPYPALHQDCVDLVADFRDYVVHRGLDDFLRERQRKYA